MGLKTQAPIELPPGYQLVSRLGSGGFGEVWKVQAPGGLFKAAKIIKGNLNGKEGENIAADQELRALQRIQSIRHPYLLSLERYDIIDGRLIIIMELADGNLWDRFHECRDRQLPGIPRDELLCYFSESAEVLDLINGQYDLQHLDIKPQNLFLVHRHMKVGDFGLVKDLEGMRTHVTGGVTPVYAAPETFDGIITRYCDQYSLAIVYQELLTGVRPFNGTNIKQLLLQHMQSSPNLDSLPASERPIIKRALAKKPEDRFPNCTEFVQALYQAVSSPGLGRSRSISIPKQSDSVSETHLTNKRTNCSPSPIGSTSGSTNSKTSSSGRIPVLDGNTPRSAASSGKIPIPTSNSLNNSSGFINAGDRLHQEVQIAPPELAGDGLLTPTIVIGLGGLAGEILYLLRKKLIDRYGSLEKLPHLKFTLIDSDTEITNRFQAEKSSATFSSNEMVLTPLNRPAYYYKPRRNGRTIIENWFDPQRFQNFGLGTGSQGIRALGRLSFCDHYRLISTKLQDDLQTCLLPDSLSFSDVTTGLGIRSNRPRIYIVSSLMGGTGSGMLIDTAYTIRHKLRRMGYENIIVSGLFLVPGAEGQFNQNSQGIINTYAALRELRHFSDPNRLFQADYVERDGILQDDQAPFQNCFLIPYPSPQAQDKSPGHPANLVANTGKPLIGTPQTAPSGNSTESIRTLHSGADFLFRELFTPLGKIAQAIREKSVSSSSSLDTPNSYTKSPNSPQEYSPVSAWNDLGLYPHLHAFATAAYYWPKDRIRNQLRDWLALSTLHRWLEYDSLTQAELQKYLSQQLQDLGASPEIIIQSLQKSIEISANLQPEVYFDSLVEPFVGRGWFSRSPDRQQISAVFSRIVELVGVPAGLGYQATEGIWEQSFKKEGNQIAKKLIENLMIHCKQLLEHPDYRIRGSEQALSFFEQTILQVIEQYEVLFKDFDQRAAEAYNQIDTYLNNPTIKRCTTAELIESLKRYPKCRYQNLVLRQLHRIYRHLYDSLGQSGQEIAFCRKRMEDLIKQMDTISDPPASSIDQPILSQGFQSIEEIIDDYQKMITNDDFRVLDRQIQMIIKQDYQSLLDISLTSVNLIDSLGTPLLQECDRFLQNRFQSPDITSMFLEKISRTTNREAFFRELLQQSRPKLVGGKWNEFSETLFFGVPESPVQEILQNYLKSELKIPADYIPFQQIDEIVVQREWNQLNWIDLPQLGHSIESLYKQLADHTVHSPHARTDITHWEDFPNQN